MNTKLQLTFVLFLFWFSNSFAQQPSSIEIQCPYVIEQECGTNNSDPQMWSYWDFLNMGGIISSECSLAEESFSVTIIDSVYLEDFERMDYFLDISIQDDCGNTGFSSCIYSRPVEFIAPEDIYASNYCGSNYDILSISGLPLSPTPSIISTEEFVQAGGKLNNLCDPGFYEPIEIEYYDVFLQDDNLKCQTQFIRTFHFFHPYYNYNKTLQQYIGIFDYEAPVLVKAPEDVTVYGHYDVAVIFQNYQDFVDAGGIVTDNCSIDEAAFEIIGSDSYGHCPITISKYYGIYDKCGNRISVKHTTFAYDTIPPDMRCPSGLTYSCMKYVPQPYADLDEFKAAGGWAFDRSEIQSFRFVNEILEGVNPNILTRTYEVTDNCGNSSTCEQTIEVTDGIPPEASCPAIQIECIGDLPPAFVDMADFTLAGGKISDNCEMDLTYFHLINEVSSGTCPKVITRTYQISDVSGNTSVFDQVIHVSDLTAPTVSDPAPIADVEFGSNLPVFETLETNDNCGFTSTTTSILPYTIDENGYPVTYVWTVTDACSNQTEVSASFNVLPKPQLYCEPVLTASSEWISGVSIDGQSHASLAGAGYEDFSNDFTFYLTASGTHTLTLTPDFSGRSNFEYWTVWIDFNLDSEFTEDEKVFSADKKRSVVTGEITIPFVENMETRMRVIMSSDGAPIACPQAGNGEAEDYLVVIAGVAPQPPVASFTSDKTTVVAGGSIQFFDESANNPTTRLWTFAGGEPASSTVSNPLVTYKNSGIFDVILTVGNDMGEDVYTSQVTVTEQPVPVYCESKSLSASKEWIESVSIGSINNHSGAATYSDFTSLGTTLSGGESALISLTPGFSRNIQGEYWQVWIDFNQDSDFDDEGEMVFSSSNARSSVSGNIVIPAGAMPGTTRMRISMKARSFSSPCEIFDRGEVEDYTVDILNTKSALTDVDQMKKDETWMVFPNPAASLLNVEYKSETVSVISIYSSQGAMLKQQLMINDFEQVDVRDIAPGAYYIILQSGEIILRKKFIKK